MARGELRASRWWLQDWPDDSQEAPPTDSEPADSDLPDSADPSADTAEQAPARREGPLHLRWQYQPLVSPDLARQIRSLVKTCAGAEVVPRSTWTAHVDNDTIYRRTMRGVAAVDSESGVPRWHFRLFPNADTNLQTQPGNRRRYDEILGNLDQISAETRFEQLDMSILSSVFCRDGVQSQLAADGQRIYLVAEGVEAVSARSGFQLNRSGIVGGVFRGSQLIALQKTSGRRVWSAGGHVQERPLGTELANAWFAGPPKVRSGRLWCIIEQNSEIRLACLQPQTGELNWEVTLAFPRQSIDKDPARRLWSATPQTDGGLVWCPTTTGWLVTVDSLTQSVLWASRLDLSPGPSASEPVARGRQYVNTDAQSLKDQWAPQDIVLAGDQIVCFPQEFHEICIFNALTGKLNQHIAVRPGSILMHIDHQHVVIGDATVVECYSLPTGASLWKRELTNSDGMPTGRGILRGQHLLTMMSNGSIAEIDLTDGSIDASHSVPLSDPAWGHLLEEPGGDIVRMAPDRLLRLSFEAPDSATRNPLELADAFYSSGDWQQALATLELVPQSERQSREFQNLLFSCQLQQAWHDGTQPVDSIRQTASTLEQRLQVQVLVAHRLLQQQNQAQAMQQLLEILQHERSLLSSPVPFLSSSTAPGSISSAPTAESEFRPARTSVPISTWATAALSKLLNSADNLRALENLQSLPDSVLLQLDSPAILDLLMARSQQSQPAELSLHLLLHALEISRTGVAELPGSEAPARQQIVSRLQPVLQRHTDPAKQDATADESSQQAIQRLMNCLAIELAESYGEPDLLGSAAGEGLDNSTGSRLLPRSQLDLAFREKIRDQWNQWKLRPYQMLPFAQPTSFSRMSAELNTAVVNDPFLREYRWSVLREPTRLQAASATDPAHDSWSVPGSLATHSGYSGTTDAIARIGSILLIRSPGQITAISVLDRQVLWSRRIDRFGQNDSSDHQAPTTFAHFDPQETLLPGDSVATNCRIIGYGFRWLAIMANHRIEILDLLNGYSLWSATSESGWANVSATDAVVAAVSADGTTLQTFRRQDGSPTNCSISSRQAMSAIMGIDSLMLTLQTTDSPADTAETRLQWVEPLSGIVERELSFGTASHFQFPDDGSLAGFTDTETFRLVSFRSGEVIDGDFSPAVPKDLPDDSTNPPAEHWAANQVCLATDLLHCYVSRSADDALPGRNLWGSRRITAVSGEVRAVHRHTGQPAWHFTVDSPGFAATDQPYLPVFIVFGFDTDSPNAAGQTVQQNRFQGVLKATGEKLFDEVVPSRFALRTVNLQTDDRLAVDIEVFGNRVRIEPLSDAAE
jgi:outer membrane protein assembly factor BamB